MGRMDFPGKWRLCFSIFSCLKFPKFCSSINLIHYINITISQVNDCAKLLQSCLTHCDLMDCSPPGSSVHGVLQERILEWAAISFSKGSSWPRGWTQVSFIAGECFTSEPLEYEKWKWKLISCVWLFVTPWTICISFSPPVQGILQVRILEWRAFPFSKGSS